MCSKICILGGGFVSSALARHLGPSARVVPRSELDLVNSDAVDSFFEQATWEHVILCATVGGSRLVPDPEDTVERNIRMFLNVEAHCSKFKKMIWFSSGAYKNPKSRYGLSKRILERISAGHSNIFCLRIFGCFGVDELPSRFLSTCVREGKVTISDDRYFDMVSVWDLCRVVDHVLGTPTENGPIDIVYPEKWKLSELAHMVGAVPTITGTSADDYTGTCGIDFLTFEPMPCCGPSKV